jgi:hypothetical protein
MHVTCTYAARYACHMRHVVNVCTYEYKYVCMYVSYSVYVYVMYVCMYVCMLCVSMGTCL